MGAAGSSSSSSKATKTSKVSRARHPLNPAAPLRGRAQIGDALVEESAVAWIAPAAAPRGEVRRGSSAMPNEKARNPDEGGVLRVAQDGSGHFRSVQAAIDALPLPNSKRVVISVAPGVYRQPVYVPKLKNRITLQVWHPSRGSARTTNQQQLRPHVDYYSSACV